MNVVSSLSDEPISRAGPLTLHAISPDQTVLDALRLMQARRTGCVVVCQGRRPVGVFTERDILRIMGTTGRFDVPLAVVTSGQVWSLREQDSLRLAIMKMNEYRCRHLVVVNDEGDAVGTLSVRQLVAVLVDHFPKSVYNLPPKSNQVPKDREGA